MNLFTIAAGNGVSLEERTRSLCACLEGHARSAVERFADRVERDGRVAINMRQSVLLSFLTSGAYQNIYDWAEGRARRSSKPLDAILRERLGGFYDRRVAFDRSIEGGERIRYGALNIGGVGATAYGSYCAVMEARVPAGRLPTAYLPGDSLATYVVTPADGGSVIVDADGVRRDLAPHSHRHCLAAIKLEQKVRKSEEQRWPSLLCSATEYVEALFTGDLRPEDLQCVRMTRSDHDLYFGYAFEDFRARLGEADRILVESFASILDALEARGIALEVVDD